MSKLFLGSITYTVCMLHFFLAAFIQYILAFYMPGPVLVLGPQCQAHVRKSNICYNLLGVVDSSQNIILMNTL